MSNNELYEKYVIALNDRALLEKKINEYIEKWKNGDTVLDTKKVEEIVNKGIERVEYLKQLENEIHEAYIKLEEAHDQKVASDMRLRDNLGSAPSNINITGGVLGSKAEDSHLIAETKTEEEMRNDKIAYLDELRDKVRKGEIPLEKASQLKNDVNNSYNFYELEEEMNRKYK